MPPERHRRKRPAGRTSKAPKEAASDRDRAAEVREKLVRLGAPRRRVATSAVTLMLAETREKPFTKPGWLWELKYDGFRLLASREENQAHLRYRKGMDATAVFPEVVRVLGTLSSDSLILDGEVVVLDEKARPSFGRLQKRALLQRSTDIERASVALPAILFVFDLLAFEDFDLRPLPLTQRKALLQSLLPRAGPIRFADHIDEQGEALWREAGRLGLEGIMGKRADAPYRGGRSSDWLKIRLDRSADFAIVGFTSAAGSRSGFGALHLAYWEDAGLVYAGRVGTGFSEKQLTQIGDVLRARLRSTPPCAGAIPKGRGHTWVEPELVCEVRFKEWTGEGLMRQPAFLRLRDDKPLSECVREPGAGSR